MSPIDRRLHPVRLPDAWAPDSWRARPARQLPQYPDAGALEGVLRELRALPPLVTSWEILALKQQLAEAQEGRRFLLQGGDCAESFDACTSEVISNRLKVLLQMSLVLVHGMRKPVVRVGRFAGQYAKPRSADSETIDGLTLPSYRGDMVNAPAFTAEARTPDPRRMVKAHARSAMTMNFVRALIDGGFADLHHPEYWNLSWVGHSPLADEYRRMVEAIGDAVRFMETLSGEEIHNLNRVDFYTSHEALLLPYEEALTRQVPRHWGWFNLSTHFPWIGMRTADVDGAHVEYFRGIRNPVAVKVGPSVAPDALLRLIDVLNPEDEPGRLTLIHRMGAAHIAERLPPLLDAVRRDGRRVLWVCDPMHGNTETTRNGYKTRRFANIGRELELAFELHAAAGTRLGGVHLELTGEDVTECLGGARELTETDLERAYCSTVDPRLNYEQALEVAMLIVRKHGAG
ncbi:class II 3-deoxy-7-phosphoheptulonate synthase [Vulcaniibacterium thermophilum]|jgi:3-deoxy-7-phosphoheptulonate synthase|uniref:Phospho-2-dehydro-3-deoxyheptonate aldolase n=1 Tax=Vulcaniibacterium thermophilum TaxID=1169913 RepID=A0A918ZAF6_9GAMM|nr:3-deoxy-7-phosphoheptulonate synthase class II [Vulcaniibacterium thermophilum]GHE43161.1 phospho-2-dehydro-3-deoxyheptonate aldolase [Vulcaniibacterium thermophilum]